MQKLLLSEKNLALLHEHLAIHINHIKWEIEHGGDACFSHYNKKQHEEFYSRLLLEAEFLDEELKLSAV